jgi:hypothetical protein
MAYKRVSPQPVVEGGTGDSSLTAYAVLTGGTTSTGAIQSIASVGTSGQVLTSNGAAALPTFQAAGGGGITTINGNSGSVTGSTVTITTGASNAQGTSRFTGSGTTLTQTFSTASGNNTGIGFSALASVTGTNNTAFGYNAGSAITSAGNSTIIGSSAGATLSSGVAADATFVGYSAGNLATGGANTLIGCFAGYVLTTGVANTVIGSAAGSNYTSSEGSNICIGYNVAGTAAESNVLRIGTATGASTGNLNKAIICGVTGITVTGTAVLVSATNQLGVAVSSSQFKNDIKDMGSDSDALYKLRPVSFTWNKDSAPGLKDATDMRQYGLIAEEAVKVVPHCVNLDKDGKPFNINYHDLIGMLVNEVQRLSKRIDALESK